MKRFNSSNFYSSSVTNRAEAMARSFNDLKLFHGSISIGYLTKVQPKCAFIGIKMYGLDGSIYGICTLKVLSKNINGLQTVQNGDDSTFSRPQTELNIAVCFGTPVEILI